MFCTDCGTRIDDAVKFCPSCGVSTITDKVKTADESTQDVIPAKVENQSRSFFQKFFKTELTKKKRKNSVYTFFVIVLIGLFIPYASVQLTLFSKDGIKESVSFAMEAGVFLYIPLIVAGIVTCYVDKYLFTIVCGILIALIGCVGVVQVLNHSGEQFGTTIQLHWNVILLPVVGGLVTSFQAKKLLQMS